MSCVLSETPAHLAATVLPLSLEEANGSTVVTFSRVSTGFETLGMNACTFVYYTHTA